MTTPSELAFTPRFLGWEDYLMLTVYFAANLGIGWWWSRRGQSSGGYFLGNGRIGWLVAAISFFATKTSSISFMALPAKSYQSDWLSFGSSPAQSMAGLVVGLFLVRLLRRQNITTVYTYLERRFDRRVQLLGAGLGVLLKVCGRLSVVMLLPALALSTVTGLNVYLSILLMGVVTTIYAMEGGFEAVIWTEVLQVIVTYGGVILALFFLLAGVDGGLGGILKAGNDAEKFHMVSWAADLSEPTAWVFIGMFFGHIFTQLADQPLMQRMLATANEHEAQRTVLIGNLLGLASSITFFFIGTALYVFYQAHPDRLVGALPNDAIFPYFIANELPRGAVGLVVAGLFAAAMGSLSSTINSVAAIVVTDFQGKLQPRATETQRLRLAKLSTLACGVLGTGMASYLAYRNVASLWDEFLRIIALVGGGFPGVFALGLLTRRAHSSGVIIGALASIGVTWLVQNYTSTNVFLHGFVAVGSCMVIGYVASLLIPPRKTMEPPASA
jgi:SSS family transporter